MTIVHINIGLGGGGAEHILLELAKKGNNDGVKTIVIAISDIKTIEKKFKNHNIEFHYLNVNSTSSFFKGLTKLHNILKSYNDVILHCHMVHGLIMGVCYKLRYKSVPVFFTLHNILVEHIYRRYLLFFTKPLRVADINFSKNSNKWYLKPVHVIANGVDFNKFNNYKARSYNKINKFIFLFLGRIEEQKNPLIVIDLVTRLLESNTNNFRINIAGDGNMRKELEQLIIEKKYEDYITILGFQDNIKLLMENSHCLILPSLWEGLPVSLIEASASRLPIITTPVGSIPDYYNTSNCFVSNLDEFHNKMKYVIENYKDALQRANKSFDDNKSVFDIDSVYMKHKKLYQKFI